MGQMLIDRICCLSDLTLVDANDDQSNYSAGSTKSNKSTKKNQEKIPPNAFRTSLSQNFANKNIPLNAFYKRASIIAPSSEIILNNPDKKNLIKSIVNCFRNLKSTKLTKNFSKFLILFFTKNII